MFSQELKKLRTEKKLTQHNVSELLKVPIRTVQQWEYEERTPPEYVQRLILKELKGLKKMNKYNVTCITNKSEERDNYVGDYVTAENEKVAIEIAIECIRDAIYQTTEYEVKTFKDKIEVYNDDNEVVETYYDFVAEEI